LICDQNVKDAGGFMRKLSKEGWKIILLNRSNILRQSISEYLARCTGTWIRYAGQAAAEPAPVRVDLRTLTDYLSRRESMRRLQTEALAGIPHLWLVYEHGLLDPERHQRTADKVFDYIGIASRPVRTAMVRLIDKPLCEFIENYEEMRGEIEKTKYAWCLSDARYESAAAAGV